jgi:predicted ATPase with chaperone activity
VATLNSQAIIATRPFRSPHHTISDAGGTVLRPGEVSLAHNGVVFPCAMNYRNSGAQALEMIGSL